jgi:shikimate kinase
LLQPELTIAAPTVSLIGMPGSGKSTIGRELARRLALPFADCDEAIERAAGRSIAALFASAGENAFRDLESRMVAELVGDGPCVIATGGGVVLRAANRELLRSRSRCVYLRASHELLWKRLRRDRRRPLLQVADVENRIREMVAEREPLYQETASLVVDTDELSFHGLVQELTRRLRVEASR